jgi:integrase
MTVTMETDLPYLERDEDRHGNERIYVRRSGKRIRIRETEGTPAFAKAYAEAVEKLDAQNLPRATKALPTHAKGTLGWLGAQYFVSKGDDEFLSLDKDSQRARRNNLEECFRVTLSDEDKDPMGNCPLKYFSAQKAKRMIEAVDGPGARTNRRKHLSALCSWGVENNHLSSNPVRDIKAGRAAKGSGYYTWLIEDVEQFLAFHQKGTKARLALGLLLFSGSRRQDVVSLGKQHCRGPSPDVLGDWIRYVPKKTIKKRRTVVQKPMLPLLKEIIAYSPCGSLTFLQTEYGKPFTEAGFGNWFRDRCDEASLPQCTAHGLKKAAATIAAENGATDRQLMAMFDWDSPRMAEVYTRAAEQKRLAGGAMALISLDRKENEDCRTVEAGAVAPAQKAR